MAGLRLIGYWRSDMHPELPDPMSFVDLEWDEEERDQVGAYLAGGVIAVAMMGYSTCRICGQRNGYAELTDGTYLWPEGLAHYVAEHGVRLPVEVEEHAIANLGELETAAVEAHDMGPRWWIDAIS